MEDYIRDKEIKTIIMNEEYNWCKVMIEFPQGSGLTPVMFFKEYEATVSFYFTIYKISNFQLALHFGKAWICNHSSQAITQLVPKDRRLSKLSPIAVMKAIKNPIEIKGMTDKY